MTSIACFIKVRILAAHSCDISLALKVPSTKLAIVISRKLPMMKQLALEGITQEVLLPLFEVFLFIRQGGGRGEGPHALANLCGISNASAMLSRHSLYLAAICKSARGL
mmetsp:Transcript_5984/g.8234  ORF Transcript_5984/g.8234 Transcript_5984/m.8234 type:complete len:109 (-) Transcript_5984:212-538(-)